MICYPDPAVKGTNDLLVLMLTLATMNAKGNDDLDVLIPDTAGIKAFHQEWKVNFAAGIAGDIGSNDDDPVSGANLARNGSQSVMARLTMSAGDSEKEATARSCASRRSGGISREKDVSPYRSSMGSG